MISNITSHLALFEIADLVNLFKLNKLTVIISLKNNTPIKENKLGIFSIILSNNYLSLKL